MFCAVRFQDMPLYFSQRAPATFPKPILKAEAKLHCAAPTTSTRDRTHRTRSARWLTGYSGVEPSRGRPWRRCPTTKHARLIEAALRQGLMPPPFHADGGHLEIPVPQGQFGVVERVLVTSSSDTMYDLYLENDGDIGPGNSIASMWFVSKSPAVQSCISQF